MHSKYAAPSNLALTYYLRWQTRSFVHNLGSLFTKPLETRRSFVFVAGCGHSGTTLIAGKLGRHEDIFLVGRESRIFIPNRGLYAAKCVAREWDYIAQYLGKKKILEKTPKHIHCIARILRIIPTAKFILTVRNPLDNVSSLKPRFGLEEGIKRWRIDNTPIPPLSGYPNVLIIRYEDVVLDPNGLFSAFLSLSIFLILTNFLMRDRHHSHIISTGVNSLSVNPRYANLSARTSMSGVPA